MMETFLLILNLYLTRMSLEKGDTLDDLAKSLAMED